MSKKLSLRLTKKDFKVQTFKAGGKGGQHQNKTDSGVRIIHEASNARGESRSERSQLANKKLAFERLAKSTKFKVWINKAIAKTNSGKRIDQIVDEKMNSKNLLVEGINEKGKWEKLKT